MSDIEQAIATHFPAAHKGDQEAFAELVAATQNTVTSLALPVRATIEPR